jgi:hypothetical protein
MQHDNANQKVKKTNHPIGARRTKPPRTQPPPLRHIMMRHLPGNPGQTAPFAKDPARMLSTALQHFGNGSRLVEKAATGKAPSHAENIHLWISACLSREAGIPHNPKKTKPPNIRGFCLA